MFKIFLQISIFFIFEISISASSCFTYLIGETPVSYSCGSPGSFSSSSLDIKSPYKQLTVSLSIKPTSLCSMTSDFNFLTVSILPTSTNGVRKKVMMLTYVASGNKISVRTEDLSGIKTAVDIPLKTLTNAPINFVNNPANLYLSVDLGSNLFTGGGVTSVTNTGLAITNVNYGSDWVFDSTLDISVCSDYGGVNSIGCIVQNLKVLYTYYIVNSILTFANQVRIIGDFKLDDKQTGNTLTNSQGTLSTISLALTSSPNWIPEGGLEFTSPSQFIKLPSFIPSASDLTVSTSFALTFYLKIDTAPTSTANIFTYYCSQLQVNIFQLAINPNMKLLTTVETESGEVNFALKLGEWNMISSSHQYTYGGFGTAIVYVNGLQAGGYAYTRSAQGTSHLSASDQVIVGAGFIGKLRRFQVYSPAVYQMNKYMCDTTTCAVDIGFSTPPTCLKTVCQTPGFYLSFGTCEKCPNGCLTCTDASTCQSCTMGYYSDGDGTTCKSCPKNCYSCTDFQTCQVCDSGYGFYNNNCVLCPAATYLGNDGFCKKLPQTLQDTLTGSQLLNSAGTQAANLISKGSSISLSAAVSGKLFSQIKYLNISYSGELQVALYTWLPSFVSLGLTPDIPESIIEEIPDRGVPFVFQKYDVPSSFLVNFWENLGMVVFVTVLWMIFKGLELLFHPKNSKFPRKTRIIIQNFLITVLFGVYGDLVLFSILEYRTLQIGWNLTLLSFLISIILLIAGSIIFFFQIKLLLKYQQIIKQEQASSTSDTPKLLQKFIKNNEGSQVLFKDFKDYSLIPQLFFFLLSGRDIVFSFLLATMFEHPLAQTILIILLDCLMVAYLFIKSPFKNSFDAAQQYFFEFIGLIVNLTVLLNAVLDTGKYETFEARKNIGKLIIVSNMIFNFVTAIFMLISIAQALREFYKEQKEKRAKKVITLKTVNQLQRFNSHENSGNKQIEKSFNQESITIDQNLETFNPENSFQILLPTPQKRSIKKYKPRRPQNSPIKFQSFHQNASETQNT